MKPKLSRRLFLASSVQLAAGVPAWAAISTLLTSQAESPGGAVPAPRETAPPKRTALAPHKVQAVVGQAHRSLARVKELVDAQPLLANACWDWGGGDFETPLQAAAHTGQREIADYLLSKQARPDIFAAAMLGDLEFVQAAFARNPRAHEIPGPHGFTLLHCAQSGGEAAKPVYDWLIGRGAIHFNQPLTFL